MVRTLSTVVNGFKNLFVCVTIALLSFSALANDAVKEGAYLAIAGDCTSCHTAPGGKPFAGGLKMANQFGYLLTPNITPDMETGIGAYSKDDFFRVLHDGVNKKDQDLYPFMPYVAYTKVTRADSDKIYDYLRTIPAVSNPVNVNNLDFPFNIRASMIVWRELFFKAGSYKPDPAQSTVWNRGAYLVEGLGHCSSCHSPRNLMGAIENSKAYTGSVIDGWYALNLTSNPLTGLGKWSAADIARFLKTGSYENKTTVLGPMEEVVHNSTGKMTDADLFAMGTYLKSIPANSSLSEERKKVDATALTGIKLYVENCSGCHQSSGRGINGVIPPLAGNPVVMADQPNNIIKVMVRGIKRRDGYIAMPSFASRLSNQEILEIANYVRSSWGNGADPNVTKSLVESIRKNPGL
ncbi:cytochrome c [Polynucleobacter sp. CS-Odin-A6]|uniref:c-type cytochrome n=1 Tax=Polynucleobacter sp. CS-Odin-A6 TaxID=2689106 RepID=UPI001C0E018C|nr:cytochrome c [Polynucleobacter sp. CS-Odin-A6]MBU3621484.1 cytochrome c [Polynucleobacter sp. CS-Odin-A6]